jgi:flagellar L-ring protein precursor FlgH
MKPYRWILPAALSFLMAGCASSARLSKLPEERLPAPVPQPVVATAPAPAVDYGEGSLWRSGGKLGSLFADYKARSVGDIVTIRIVEDAKATNNATTDTGKDSSFNAQVKAFLGYENRYEAGSPGNPFSKVEGGLSSSFSGSGKTQRSGQIKAEITARVVEVLPNGNLRIVGTREITVNSERQFITLLGTIQPRDISSENKIASTRIAGARIVYSGVGVVDEQQRQGWLSRMLHSIWPM